MFRIAGTAAALVTLGVGAMAVETTPPDTAAPDTTLPEATTPLDTGAETTAPTGTEPGDTGAPATTEPAAGECPDPTAAAEPATVYDDDGNPAAEITLTAFERPFTDFEEDSEPDEDREYARATLSIASVAAEDSFEVAVDQFIIQDELGFVNSGNNVRTAAQAEADEDVPGDAELEPGDSIELAATFEVFPGIVSESLLYRPSDDRLTDVAELC